MDTLITLEQFEEHHFPKRTLFFHFYEDGRLEIINAKTGEFIHISDLNRESEKFYVQKRITFIKERLVKSIQNHQ